MWHSSTHQLNVQYVFPPFENIKNWQFRWLDFFFLTILTLRNEDNNPVIFRVLTRPFILLRFSSSASSSFQFPMLIFCIIWKWIFEYLSRNERCRPAGNLLASLQSLPKNVEFRMENVADRR